MDDMFDIFCERQPHPFGTAGRSFSFRFISHFSGPVAASWSPFVNCKHRQHRSSNYIKLTARCLDTPVVLFMFSSVEHFDKQNNHKQLLEPLLTLAGTNGHQRVLFDVVVEERSD